ncbi:hypothetical protein N7456_004970 [Penicillium angulare]|uniref:Uncharacterized protein n=1 Tax=Penicillium angulare TaxID=116970 RepID=A0A9W9FXJ5_9EURO|nr:hypothetical protein N7456_004970 [Penicillium angulare]
MFDWAKGKKASDTEFTIGLTTELTTKEVDERSKNEIKARKEFSKEHSKRYVNGSLYTSGGGRGGGGGGA